MVHPDIMIPLVGAVPREKTFLNFLSIVTYTVNPHMLWFKNKNHVLWLDGQPWVCSPDLLTLAYKESGEGTTNTLIKDGDEVVAVGMKGLEAFRTEFGLNEASSPRHFGFDIDYVPIEELVE